MPSTPVNANCTYSESCKIKTRGVQLPSLLYTNCRSLSTWKLAELQIYAESHHPDLICLTETWLDDDKQQTITIDGYDNYFSHRKDRIGGGVGILVHHRQKATMLTSYTYRTMSAVWVMLDIISCSPIIVGCNYHPPNSDQAKTIDYISSTILRLTKKYPNAKYVLCGDFNQLPVADLCEQLGLHDLVNFTTRQDRKLDLILTDIPDYKVPKKLAPLSTNDHCCIYLPGEGMTRSNYIKVKRRVVRKNYVLLDLAMQDWSIILNDDNVHNQVKSLHKIIDDLIDKHCPLKSCKVRHDKPEWITPSIEKSIKARDAAFNAGKPEYKFLRGVVQRMVRSSKRKFIRSQLNDDKDMKKWWQLVKSLTNKTGNTSSSLTVY